MTSRCRRCISPWERQFTNAVAAKTCGLALLIAIILNVVSCIAQEQQQPVSATRYASRIVETKSGRIRGILQELNNQHLDPVEVFRGIPYAAPPSGDLRFRLPQLPNTWKGTKHADTYGQVCPQKLPDVNNQTLALHDMPLGRYNQLIRLMKFVSNQSEDCLYLNLYIPGSGARGLEAPYAVIVYIHGESFDWGTGNIYDGSVLASAGHVIVITLNYRLGILGFLRTKPVKEKADSSTSGNLALHDIAMGLTWIRENIGAFGGDPNRVTLIGHDTGAALANYLLLAPFGKGLFHNLILLSGSALSPWAAVHDPNDLRIHVAKQLDCDYDAGEDIAECLRGVTLKALMDIKLSNLKFMPRVGPSLPIDSSNPDPGLDMERLSDAFIKVPLILGVSTAESYLDFSTDDIQYGFEEDQRNRILRTFVRNTYVYHLNEIYSAVRNEYTDWDKPVLHPINIRESTMEALSDGHTVAPLMRIAFYHARRGANTYFFHFNYQSRDADYPQRLGSIRGEVIPYVFGLPLITGNLVYPQNYSRSDQGVAEAVLTFITNFAKTGNPNEPHNIESVDYGTVKEKTRYRGLNWEKYETGNQQYLMIALKPKMKTHYRGHKMAVWLNLIPQLHQPGDDVSMKHHHFREKGDFFYAGPVRDEWYMPLTLPGTTSISLSTTACNTAGNKESNQKTEATQSMSDILNDNKDDSELLHRLASRHYYSTTTALAITVAIGCILLVLNMLIFAGIYYQRDRDKKRSAIICTNNRPENIALSSRIPLKLESNSTSSHGPPPSYAALSNHSSCIQDQTQESCLQNQIDSSLMGTSTLTRNSSIKKNYQSMPPRPPQRTSSSLTPIGLHSNISTSSNSSIKKRVQIQEITV